MTTIRSIIGVVAATTVLIGCQSAQTSVSDERAVPGTNPSQIRVVGEAQAVSDVSRGLSIEGFKVAGTQSGRSAGLKAFCSGSAEILAISTDLSNDERSACKSMGGDWSAGSSKSGHIVYVAYYWSENIFTQSSEL